MLCKLTLGVAGFSFGLLVASGVFTVLVAVGLIPRFAAKTGTARYVKKYENAVIIGCIGGTITDLFIGPLMPELRLSSAETILAYSCIAFISIFAGIFVGCFAMAIAEMLDSIPIFARRIRFNRGMRIVVFGIAVGKLTGSLFYFLMQLYNFGG